MGRYIFNGDIADRGLKRNPCHDPSPRYESKQHRMEIKWNQIRPLRRPWATKQKEKGIKNPHSMSQCKAADQFRPKCFRVCTYIYIYIIYVCVCMYMCVRVCVCLCVCAYVCLCATLYEFINKFIDGPYVFIAYRHTDRYTGATPCRISICIRYFAV